MAVMTQTKPLPVLLIEQGRDKFSRNAFSEAEALLRHAIEVAAASRAPDISRQEWRALALFNLGRALEKQGRFAEAVEAFEGALAAKPQRGDCEEFRRVVFNNLGNIFKARSALDKACEYFERSLQIKPVAPVLVKLGNTLKKSGRREEAVAAYDRALALDPSFHLARFGRCIAELPVVCRHAGEVAESRRRYGDALQALYDHYANAGSRERVAAADVIGLLQPFYLAYQGCNDRGLQRLYGKLVHRLMSERFPQWSRPVDVRPESPGGKLRIGIVSRFLLCRHSVWKIPLKGWVDTIDRSRFELYGYHTHPEPKFGEDGSPELFTKLVTGQRSVEDWCKEIWGDRLDAIIYPEISMDPFSLPLASLRLAPVQMTGLGHPITTGLPTLDYYVSGALIEPENGQDHYTETLIKLPNLSFHYTPLTMDADVVERDRLGVAEDDVLFWCPQSLYKFLPEHDDVFPRIAEAVGRCKFLFNPRLKDRMSATFVERLRDAFRLRGLDADRYCIMRYEIRQKEYNGINAISDVFLDTIGWSGGNTNMEAFVYDLPVVTWPSTLMRGRFALGMLKLMGIEETIAATKDQYVEIAIRLARNHDYRRRISDRIARNKRRLFADATTVRAFEDFLIGCVSSRRSDSPNIERHFA